MISVEIPSLNDLLKTEEGDILLLVTFGTANRMVELIAEPKSGKQYKRGKQSHTASAPGEAPASDSSNLITSVTPLPPNEIVLAEHGFFLEFSTDTIAARPFIVPSLEEVLESL